MVQGSQEVHFSVHLLAQDQMLLFRFLQIPIEGGDSVSDVEETLHKIVSTKFRKGDQLVTIDANWLLLGEGEIYKVESSQDSEDFRNEIWAKIQELEKQIKKD